MQISVSIKGMDGAKAMISGQSRQIPFATSLAINAVAKSIDDEQLGITLPDLDRTVGNRQGAYQDNHPRRIDRAGIVRNHCREANTTATGNAQQTGKCGNVPRSCAGNQPNDRGV